MDNGARPEAGTESLTTDTDRNPYNAHDATCGLLIGPAKSNAIASSQLIVPKSLLANQNDYLGCYTYAFVLRNRFVAWLRFAPGDCRSFHCGKHLRNRATLAVTAS